MTTFEQRKEGGKPYENLGESILDLPDEEHICLTFIKDSIMAGVRKERRVWQKMMSRISEESDH